MLRGTVSSECESTYVTVGLTFDLYSKDTYLSYRRNVIVHKDLDYDEIHHHHRRSVVHYVCVRVMRNFRAVDRIHYYCLPYLLQFAGLRFNRIQ